MSEGGGGVRARHPLDGACGPAPNRDAVGEAEAFEPASRTLAEAYEIHQPENWTDAFASFIAPGLIVMGMVSNAFANTSFNFLAGKIGSHGGAFVQATYSDISDRTALDQVGPDVLVGGSSAVNLDVRTASERDLRVIIPTILGVIFVVLLLLLSAAIV